MLLRPITLRKRSSITFLYVQSSSFAAKSVERRKVSESLPLWLKFLVVANSPDRGETEP